jgi:hypothetical protein
MRRHSWLLKQMCLETGREDDGSAHGHSTRLSITRLQVSDKARELTIYLVA